MGKNLIKQGIFKFLCKSRIFLYRILSSQKIEGAIQLIQATQVLGLGRIIVSNDVKIGYFPSPCFFSTYAYLEARSPEAVIKIGQNTHINNGFTAIAENSKIGIGMNCLIGTCVEIYDSDFHAISALERTNGDKHISEPVYIGNDVFIGSNVKILKGVTIGNGAVIANGSVVTKNIPANVIAAGVPATVRKVIDEKT